MVKTFYDIRHYPFDNSHERHSKVRGIILARKEKHELIILLTADLKNTSLSRILVKNSGPDILYVYCAKNIIDGLSYWFKKKSPMNWLDESVPENPKDLFNL